MRINFFRPLLAKLAAHDPISPMIPSLAPCAQLSGVHRLSVSRKLLPSATAIERERRSTLIVYIYCILYRLGFGLGLGPVLDYQNNDLDEKKNKHKQSKRLHKLWYSSLIEKK